MDRDADIERLFTELDSVLRAFDPLVREDVTELAIAARLLVGALRRDWPRPEAMEVGVHSGVCWRWHPQCARMRLNRINNLVKHACSTPESERVASIAVPVLRGIIEGRE